MKIGETKPNSRWLSRALSPWVVIPSIGLGMLYGAYYPQRALELAPVGKLFMSLLGMCVLPMLITAIVSGLGRLLLLGHPGSTLRRMLTVFAGGLAVVSVFALLVAVVVQPGGNLSHDTKQAIGRLLSSSEFNNPATTAYESPTMMALLKQSIPSNPFASASEGNYLAVIFFSMLMGLSLGFVRQKNIEVTLSVFEVLSDASLLLIRWMLYTVPVGLFCLFAYQFAHSGSHIFIDLGKLVLTIYGVSIVLLITYVIVIARISKISIRRALQVIKDPFFAGLATSSSFASLPVVVSALQEKLKLDKRFTNLVLPLAITLNPHGSVMWATIVTVFMAKLYAIPLGIAGALFIVIGAILTGLAVTGVPGIATTFMLSIVLAPLGIPVGSTLILLLAIDPLLDPIVTAVNVVGNCATTTAFGALHKDELAPAAVEVDAQVLQLDTAG